MESLNPATVVCVLLVMAWLAQWYYSHCSHKRDEAEAERQAQATTDSAVERALEEERQRIQDAEPRHAPPLHEQFMAIRDCRAVHAKLDAELARQASNRKGLYADVEAQARDLSALKAVTTEQAKSISELSATSRGLATKIDNATGEMKLLNQQVSLVLTNLLNNSGK